MDVVTVHVAAFRGRPRELAALMTVLCALPGIAVEGRYSSQLVYVRDEQEGEETPGA